MRTKHRIRDWVGVKKAYREDPKDVYAARLRQARVEFLRDVRIGPYTIDFAVPSTMRLYEVGNWYEDEKGVGRQYDPIRRELLERVYFTIELTPMRLVRRIPTRGIRHQPKADPGSFEFSVAWAEQLTFDEIASPQVMEIPEPVCTLRDGTPFRIPQLSDDDESAIRNMRFR